MSKREKERVEIGCRVLQQKKKLKMIKNKYLNYLVE